MKHLIPFLFLVAAPSFVFSQTHEPLGINLTGYAYPYQVNRYAMESQGQTLEMAYMYEKAPDPKGITVLLLHGKNFNGAYWGKTVANLLKEGFHVLVPDQIGFGKSSKPDYYQYTFQQLALNTRNLMDSLGVQEVVVLGHSMGGMLATRFALMYPQKTLKLILLNPIGLEDWKLKVPYQPVKYWYEQELRKNIDSVKEYMRKSYFDGKWKDAYNEWVYLLTAPTESPSYRRLAWNAALTHDMIFTQPIIYELETLQVPVVLIIGQRDRTALGTSLVEEEVAATMGNYPELGKRAARLIPDATLEEIPGIGHLPHIEAFDKFISVLYRNLKE